MPFSARDGRAPGTRDAGRIGPVYHSKSANWSVSGFDLGHVLNR